MARTIRCWFPLSLLTTLGFIPQIYWIISDQQSNELLITSKIFTMLSPPPLQLSMTGMTRRQQPVPKSEANTDNFTSLTSINYLRKKRRGLLNSFLDGGLEGVHGIDIDDREAPKVVWLMSFPNSGTTFMIDTVRKVSNRTTADNYGNVFLDPNVPDVARKNRWKSVPLYTNHTEGPFLSSSLPLPRRFILTKTHCGGYQRNVPPSTYVTDSRIFGLHCRSGVRFAPHVDRFTEGQKNRWDNLEGEVNFTRYEMNLVKRAIHLIRNPFDNVVSRFHHEYHIHEMSSDTEFTERYPFNRTGFQAWCAYWDGQNREEEARMYNERIDEAIRDGGIPCHAEFYKYVQWHNNAFVTTDSFFKEKNVLLVKYHDFRDHFMRTADKIFSFLDVVRLNWPTPFYEWTEYTDFYNDDQRRNVSRYIRLFASAELQKELDSWLVSEHDKDTPSPS